MKKRYSLLSAAMAIVFSGGTALSAAPPYADLQLDLPPQSLEASLRAVGKTADLNFLIDRKLVSGMRAPALRASISVDDALERLLKGSGLEYKFVGDKTVVLAAAHNAPGESGKADAGTAETVGSTGNAQDSAYRIAQADEHLAGADSMSGAPAGTLAEVIVTAQRREQRLIDVPISLTALSAQELENRKINNIDDLAMAVPGMSITTMAASRRIEIRGINNIFGNGAVPNVGLYLDEADVTGNNVLQPDLGIYDLERVEVLRGPQGTLYGAGSTGGTVRFITRNPVLDRFEFDSTAAAMLTKGGDPSQRIQEVVNIPLVDDVLGLRVAGSFEHAGGWVDSPAAGQSNFNSQNRTDVRIKGLWKPSERFSLSAMALIHRNDAGMSYGEDGQGNYTQVYGLTTTPRLKDQYNIYNITATYDLDFARLLSTSTYSTQNLQYWNEGLRLQAYGPPGSVNSVLAAYEPYQTSPTKSFVQELRLNSRGDSPWQWTLGAYYKYLRNDPSFLSVYQSSPEAGLPVGQGSVYPVDILNVDGGDRNGSVFGDTSYKLGRLTIGAGVRYFKDVPLIGRGTVVLCCGFGAFPSTGQVANTHSTDPRFYADYKATDQVAVYVSAAKGFRPGGANAAGQPSFGPESLWTYELGTKTSFLDNRLTLNGAIFYSRYTDYQIHGIAPPPVSLSISTNGGDAWIKGIEWDFNWRPSDAWTLSLAGDFLDTRFYDVGVINGAYAKGDGLDFIPKHIITAAVQRDFAVSDKKGFVRLDYSQQGRETYRNRYFNGPTAPPSPWFFSTSDVIDMLNFNSTIQWNENLSLGLFAQNLLNDRGLVNPGSRTATQASEEVNIVRSRPRTFGVQFSVNFD